MHGSMSTDDELLAGERLCQLRRLAGFSQPGLERCAGLSAGRVANVENGRARFRPWESSKVKRLLFEAMADRAREIAKYIPAGPARAEGSESSAAESSP